MPPNPKPSRLHTWAAISLLLVQPLVAQAQSTATPSSPSTPGTPAADPPITCGGSPSTPPCGGGGPASQAQAATPAIGAGNPIHLATGNKHQTEIDMPALPGVLGLELVRHYSSALSRADAINGNVGRGWRLSYETRLHVIGATVQILQADGGRAIFSRDPKNPSHCASADAQQGFVVAVRGAKGERFVWHWSDGRRLHFDEAGHLEQIVAATGEFVALRHDRDGRLLQVTDPQGRSLKLHYAEPSRERRYLGVDRIDTPVGRYDYAYGGALPEGSTVAADLALARLIRVTAPADGGRRSLRHYLHEDARQPTLLTGIAVGFEGEEPQRLVTWAYDERGRAVLSLKGPASDPASERIVLRYTQPASPAVKRAVTEVITQRGTTTYEHVVIAGEHRLLQARGPGCASCAETDRAYGYDEQGRLLSASRLDDKGRPIETVRTERDALGRPVRVERTAGAAIAASTGKQAKLLAQRAKALLLARYEYPADREIEGRALPSFEPSLVAAPSVVAGREHQWRIERNEAGQATRITESGYSPLDAEGRPGESTIERATSYRYERINGHSVLVEIDGPLANGPKGEPGDGDITHLAWDDRGSAIVRIGQSGSRINALRYDDAGRVADVLNEEGRVTRLEHDALGHITRLTQGWVQAASPQALLQVRVQVRSYDAAGRLIEAGRAASMQAKDYRGDWRIAYDAAGRAHQLASSAGTLWSQSTDGEGRVLEARLRSAGFDRAWRYRYDEQGRITASEDSALDRDGEEAEPSLRYERESSRHTAVFDALDRPVRPPLRIDERHGERVLRAVNGAVTREHHDDFGRIVALDSADSGRSRRWFDVADRLVRMRDALGHEASYEYDIQGRIEHQVVTADGRLSATRWRYEGRRLLEVQGEAQTERYQYDHFGRRKSKTVSLYVGTHPVSATTTYGYDEAGLLQTQSLADGSLIVYERDGQGQVAGMRREAVTTPWLRWLAPGQRFASDIRSGPGGLAHYEAGNGIHTEWQRSRSGVLARLVHRRHKPLSQAQARTAFLDLLGIGSARAQERTQAPGALGQPRDPLALIDHRYLWDRAGNLLLQQDGEGRTGYAYDAANRLIAAQRREVVAVQSVSQAVHGKAALTWRYHHDANGNRLLAQEGQEGETTRRTDYAQASNRTGETDAAGQTTQLDGRRFEWDAIGRLARVQGTGFEARYSYSHRGERIGKAVERGGEAHATGYLYDDAGQLAAELNAQGRISRLYVHMADLPLGVIDGEAEPSLQAQGGWQRIADDLKRAWYARDQATTFLHLNHLGAPEAATDKSGAVVWAASYAPYGRATVREHGFALKLRLPGQYEDDESGLHYNRHRYYDPEHGRYLSADPLGLRGGANGYIYVAANPLRYVDPDGLVLFAFDGTNNTNDEQWLHDNGSSVTNVWRFRQLYESGNARYITGVGTVHRDAQYGDIEPPLLDDALNRTGVARIDRMRRYLNDEADLAGDDDVMEVDIVGFSRGASEARDFANQIVANTRNGCYSYTDGNGVQRYQRVHFRFMGLWDTVLSTNIGRGYNLAIPGEFASVAHATALNEYRGNQLHAYGSVGAFPLESIAPATSAEGHTRIERGFLGAHADIGGGFGADESQLAQVALAWMVQQARSAGVQMNSPPSTVAPTPVVHDRSRSIMTGAPTAGSEDRTVHFADGSTTTQRQWLPVDGMSYIETRQFISYFDRNDERREQQFQTGTVDMRRYLAWLRENGYDLGDLQTESGP